MSGFIAVMADGMRVTLNPGPSHPDDPEFGPHDFFSRNYIDAEDEHGMACVVSGRYITRIYFAEDMEEVAA